MNFKSPTTTNFDLQIKEKLEKISEINSDELSACLINAGESLLDKRMIQIVYDDFKEFTIEGKKVGLSQTICKSKEEYLKLKDDLSNYLLDACKSSGYDLMISMLTNPNGTGSYLISEGDKKAVGDSLFKENKKEGFVEGLVSRKKQLLPAVIAEMGK